MKLYIYEKETNRFNGVVYNEDTEAIRKHHNKYNQGVISSSNELDIIEKYETKIEIEYVEEIEIIDGEEVFKTVEKEVEVKVPIYKEVTEFLQLEELATAYKYLADTDFYMTVDKYESLDEEIQIEIKSKRQEARDLINSIEG